MAGARMVYGAALERLFGVLAPVPPSASWPWMTPAP